MMLVIPLAVNRDTNDSFDLCCVIQTRTQTIVFKGPSISFPWIDRLNLVFDAVSCGKPRDMTNSHHLCRNTRQNSHYGHTPKAQKEEGLLHEKLCSRQNDDGAGFDPGNLPNL